MAEQQATGRRAVAALEKAGVEAWGQIAATRQPAKTIAAVARARGVEHVIVCGRQKVRLAQIVEGDLAQDVGPQARPGRRTSSASS